MRGAELEGTRNIKLGHEDARLEHAAAARGGPQGAPRAGLLTYFLTYLVNVRGPTSAP